jgi:hypothetical protein
MFQKRGLRVSRPFYYTPLWVIEGRNKTAVIKAADQIIIRWQKLNPQKHTENIIAVKTAGIFRIFIFLRDTRRLAGAGKSGDMASFECGGDIVLSYKRRKGQRGKHDEGKTFDNAKLDTVKALLADIAPIVPDADVKLFSNR